MKRTTLLLSAALLGLSACANGDGGAPLAKMSFDHLTPYPLYVASYEVSQSPAVSSAQIPEGFVANPANIADAYFTSRFTKAGTQGKLHVTVDSMSVTHHIEDSKNSIGAFIGVDHHDVYKITLSVRIDAYGIGETQEESNTITAHRTVSISEHDSIVERERAQMDAIDSLIDDLDVAVRKVLSEQFHLMH